MPPDSARRLGARATVDDEQPAAAIVWMRRACGSCVGACVGGGLGLLAWKKVSTATSTAERAGVPDSGKWVVKIGTRQILTPHLP